MAATVPHQKVVHVNRQKCDKNFLQISKENWYAANKDLEPYGLQLYLYIAGNMDGFNLALSQEAAEQEAGIKKSGSGLRTEKFAPRTEQKKATLCLAKRIATSLIFTRYPREKKIKEWFRLAN